MRIWCIAPLCRNSTLRFSTFKIPDRKRFPELNRKWHEKIATAFCSAGLALAVGQDRLALSTARLCEEHFKPSDFTNPFDRHDHLIQVPSPREARQRLKSHAIPSVFIKPVRLVSKVSSRVGKLWVIENELGPMIMKYD